MKLKILFTTALLCAATSVLAQKAPASIPAGGSPVDSANAQKNAEEKAKEEARKERRAHRRAINHHHRRKH